MNDAEKVATLRAALEAARTGLLWYWGEFPKLVCKADHEMRQEIDAALAATAEPVKPELPVRK